MYQPYENRRIDVEDVLARIEREGIAARLSVGEATALIVSRVKPGNTGREAKNLVRMQICRALDAGTTDPEDQAHDRCLVAEPDGQIAIGELIRWATPRYGSHFDGLPRKTRILPCSFREEFTLGASANAVALPGSLDRAHAEIERQQVEIQRLKDDAASAEERHKKDLVARFKRK